MFNSQRFRFCLALLVLVGQLVGVGSAPAGPSQKTAKQTYYCCCVGECHCTGDCCHHPPDRSPNTGAPSLDNAGDWPIVQSSKSCGVSQGIFNRISERCKLFRPRAPFALDPADHGRRRTVRLIDALPSTRSLLSLISPRAPPRSFDHSPAFT